MFKQTIAISILMIFVLLITADCHSGVYLTGISKTTELRENIILVFGIEPHYILVCNIKSKDEYEIYPIRLSKNNNSLSLRGFTWNEKNKTLFVCEASILKIFSLDGFLSMQYSISDFNIDSSIHEFGGLLATQANSLLLSVEPIADNHVGVICWDTGHSTADSVFRYYDMSKEPDPFGRVILDLGTEGGVYTVDSQNFKNRNSFGEYIVSTGIDGSIFQVTKDLSAHKKLNLHGGEPMWGNDNLIYYTKRGSELWRYNINSMKTERVFSSGLVQLRNEKVVYRQLHQFNDRKCMAFLYINPAPDKMVNSFEAYRCGIFIFDTEHNEYIDLPPEWFYNIYMNLHNKDRIELPSRIYSYLTQKKHFLHIGYFEVN